MKIDIEGAEGDMVAASDGEGVEILEPESEIVAPEKLAEEITHEMPAAQTEDKQATTPEETEKTI